MTVTNKIIPAHLLRLYAWEVLKNNTSIGLIDNLVPIIPISDEPQVRDAGKTYMIYGYTEDSDTDLTEVRGGLFVLRIIGKTFAEVGEITSVLSRAFENEDESAANINLWSSTNDALVGIRFTNTRINYVEGGTPPDEEGGEIEGQVHIKYRYVTHQTIKSFKANGTWS